MDRMTLFAATPPSPRLREPLEIDVPERYRAELYRTELEGTRRLLEGYAHRHPQVSQALLDPELIDALALMLDDYVGPAVATDVNAFVSQTFPGENITADMYRQYAAACLERAADPYQVAADWQISALSSPPGAWAGLLTFYRRYPMVRFMVNVVTENFQRNLQRCCDRVIEDWPDLQTFFFGGTMLNALTGIKTTGSDFHKGGAQVLILKFRDANQADQNLVYKPSDVERDFRIVGDTQALTAALANLSAVTRKGVAAQTLLNNGPGSLGEMLTAQANGRFTVPVYRILPVWPGSSLALADGAYPIRQSYGYLEFLTCGPADNRVTAPQRTAYYRTFGAQLALCWIFQITDLHQENLIVHGHMPYLIDLEIAYTGIMTLPGETNLGAAFNTFTVQSTQRVMTGFGSQTLAYAEGTFPALNTKNALYDNAGLQIRPNTDDSPFVTTGFTNAAQLILQNGAAYDTWLVNAQNAVTRILPEGTSFLLSQLRAMNDPGNGPAISVTFPDEISLKMARFGELDVQRWSGPFCNAAVIPQVGVANVDAINLNYDALAPKFSIWFDPQTSTDFESGDVPAYYQKMNTPQALNSRGAPIKVNYGLAVLNAAVPNQQPLANALVTIWGTQQPLLPSSYFTGNVFQIQRNYLQALLQNNNNFMTNRVNAAINEIGQWRTELN